MKRKWVEDRNGKARECATRVCVTDSTVSLCGGCPQCIDTVKTTAAGMKETWKAPAWMHLKVSKRLNEIRIAKPPLPAPPYKPVPIAL